eukprot:GEMP01029914.1.p1 GENE.GEMP01029914.1~~GEMP01029914.1.p1  ORF type:complete len:217 (+),score=51.36 GEMP01029914.1:38-688(+)
MLGAFSDAFIWVTPKVQDGSSWSIDAETVTYEINSDNIVTLRIIKRHSAVKVEPAEEAELSRRAAVFSAGPVLKPHPVQPASSSTPENDAPEPAGASLSIFDKESLSNRREPPRKRRKRRVAPGEENRLPSDGQGEQGQAISFESPAASVRRQHNGVSACTKQHCTVPGCGKFVQGRLCVDQSGSLGGRCVRHGGGSRCAVPQYDAVGGKMQARRR